MILIITGNGKGKTTSALGTAIRACGWGKRTAIVFFDKGGSHYGEQHILDLLQEKIETYRFGLERFDPIKKTFRFKNTPEDREEAEKGLHKATELCHAGYFLVVCDEIINCLNLGLLKEEDVQDLINHCPKEVHLVLTGRNVPEWLAEKSDLISEVKEVKHYFRQGVDAIEGIDY